MERILGEGIAPFRDQVVIATKFGWNIEQETGERRPGLNNRPQHIKVVVSSMGTCGRSLNHVLAPGSFLRTKRTNVRIQA